MQARKTATRARAIANLKADHIEALAKAIAAPSTARKKSEYRKAVLGRDPQKTALVILECVLRQADADDGGLRSLMTVAEDIGRTLGATRGEDGKKRLRIGLGALRDAEFAGLIEPIKRQRAKKGDQRQTTRVRLSDAALTNLWDYLQKFYVAGDRLTDDPLPEPPTGPVRIKQNLRGIETPPAMSAVYAQGLQTIRNTPWRINQFVLKTMCERVTDNEWRALFSRSNADGMSRLTALMTAQRLRDSVFYFDVQCDYRGRVYHTGHLRFTGAEPAVQALLEFARGEVITDEPPTHGAFYLAAYIGAQWGAKGTIDQIANWTLANESTLLLVAKDPAKHDAWTRDPPMKTRWQALAGADAWARFRRGEKVHLPCGWDAQCSGLQVYSLLMRDQALADLVGLTEKRNDGYYSAIGQQCAESREAVKEVAMPLLYGSAQQTSWEALEKLEGGSKFEWGTDGWKSDMEKWRARADRIRAKSEELAPAFVQVRDWLTTVAGTFAREKKPIRWETPCGFRALMDNREMDGIKLEEWVQGRPVKKIVDGKARWVSQPEKIKLTRQYPSQRFDKDAQRRGLAANVIHSMDAAYLIAVVLEGSTKRGQFPAIENWGVVHDCFAVPANQSYDLLHNRTKTALHSVFGSDWLKALNKDLAKQVSTKLPPAPEHPSMLTSEFLVGWEALKP